MNKRILAPLAVALVTLAGCGQQESANSGAAGTQLPAKAPPAGASWAQTVSFTPEGGVRMGNPDAPLKLIEFGSYTCPHCRDFATQSHEALESNYVASGRVSFEYRSFIRDPLDLTVALIARCAGPEAFFPLSNQLFQNQDAMITQIQGAPKGAYEAAMTSPPNQRFVKVAELTGLIEFAKQRGVPEEKLRACLADPKAAEALASGTEKATTQYEISGTPTILLNGSKLENVAAWPQAEERIKAAGG